MIKAILSTGKQSAMVLGLAAMVSCSSSGNRKPDNMKNEFPIGTYGYDVAFFSRNKIITVELSGSKSKASVLIVPSYQGRIMTSTLDGPGGLSFGWINYDLIESGKFNNQFNPFGGEERLWLGPEGGPFSIYFSKGSEQVFANWIVPKELDTEPFDLVGRSTEKADFRKDFTLTNASGSKLEIGIERSIRLLDDSDTGITLGFPVDTSLSYVGYESENTLINKGESDWTEKSGALSIWMLAMFNPSPGGVVVIPFKKGGEEELGPAVNDDYFGKVPSERLVIRDGILFFRTDGKYRSKIGISPQRALPYCGSYDPENRVLTLLWYSAPEKSVKYVNSKWGDQAFPFKGDVINSYNDGPVEDGSIMGPFYEIESSSPAAFLRSGEKIKHIQRIFHFSGSEEKLNLITGELFSVTVNDIKSAFNQSTE